MSAVNDAYDGSDAEATTAVYKRLEAVGPIGIIAMNLLRASKASERAKKYRGGNGRGSYRSMAYEKKDWSLTQLVRALSGHDESAGITWGWGRDESAVGYENVLYVDLPGFGQVSFHNQRRIEHEYIAAKDYGKPWDGVRGLGSSRIIRFACAVLGDPQPQETAGERDVRLKNGAQGGPTPRDARGSRRARRSRPEEGSGGGQDGLLPL